VPGEQAPLIRVPGQRRVDPQAKPLSPALAERWLQALYETPLLFSGILDEHGRVLDGNQLSIEGCGLVREDVLGCPFWECGWWSPDPEVSTQIRLWCEHALATGEPLRTTSRYFLGDRTPRVVDLSLSPVGEGDGGFGYLVATGLDITDTLTAAAARERQITRELTTVQESEYRAQERLRRLAGVALELVNAESIEDLAELVGDQVARVLGADGGVIAVPDEEGLRVAASGTLGARAQVAYGRLSLDSPLPSAHVWRTGERLVLPDRQSGLAFAPEMGDVYADTGGEAWVVVPLRLGENRLGSLAVGWAEERKVTHDDLELIEAFAAQCAQALQRISSLQAERTTAARVRLLAETLQRSLLSNPPESERLQIAVRYQPAAEEAQVGGDWYDAFLVRDGGTLLAIGDVAGHDQDAAAAMGQVRNLLRGIAYSIGEPPAAVLSELDLAMRDLATGVLATAVLARVEPPGPDEDPWAPRLQLRWSNAGHPPPLLINPDGTAELLGHEPELLLGLEPATHRGDQTQVIRPGATVVLYTDGLVERRGATVDDGLSWLVDVSARLSGLSVDDVCDVLLGEVMGSAEDDIALLAVRARPWRRVEG
jgi:PAS domain S-box-containing protein